MFHFNIIRNLAYKNIDSNINILYSPTNHIFDLLTRSLNINTYNINQSIGNYYYDMFWTNNFLEHTQQTLSLTQQMHLLDMVWFHSPPPIKFKKEDIALVGKQLKNSTKICSSQSIMDAWNFDYDQRTHMISYGIIDAPDINYTDKSEDIVLLNLNNNEDINSLFNFIREDFPTATMISNMSHVNSMQQIYTILSKYKVCIDIYSSLSALVAQYLGCKVITSVTQPKELIGIIQLSDYNEIKNVLRSSLADNLSITDMTSNREWIKQEYNYQTFNKHTMNILSKIKTEELFTI